VIIAFGCVVALLLYGVAHAGLRVVIARPAARALRRRAVLLGWGDDHPRLAAELDRDPAHPFALAGVSPCPATPPRPRPASARR
jgi:hypothetical protein